MHIYRFSLADNATIHVELYSTVPDEFGKAVCQRLNNGLNPEDPSTFYDTVQQHHHILSGLQAFVERNGGISDATTEVTIIQSLEPAMPNISLDSLFEG